MMRSPSSSDRSSAAALLVLGALFLPIGGPLAADPVPQTPQQRYEAERALCVSGLSHQQRADCLREAGAARTEANRGTLMHENEPYRSNALKRCDRLPPDDRESCLARMRGEGGIVRGSVEEGGIYRERRELVPAAPAPRQIPGPAPQAVPGTIPPRAPGELPPPQTPGAMTPAPRPGALMPPPPAGAITPAPRPGDPRNPAQLEPRPQVAPIPAEVPGVPPRQ